MSDHPKAGLAIGNTQIKVLVAGEETSSRYAITESTYGPGVRVGPHRHLSFSEINIIAEGQLQGEIDGRRFGSNPGDVVRIPKGSLPAAMG